MGDAALVAAVRCQDESALREFYLRYRPMLLVVAARCGVPPGDREPLVEDCLTDIAIHFITVSASPPRSLAAYLARSLRNRVLNAERSRQRAAAAHGAEIVGEPTEGQLAGCSEFARRASGGVNEPPLSPALQRLAGALVAGLSDDDRVLAAWMSQCAPPRQIAVWLGIAQKAASKRIERLRERLQAAALRHVESVEGEERRELLTFLGRATLASGPAARLEAIRPASQGHDAEASA
jgi:DNA-directed RNA polymerase specialized sigma24 family protein